MSFVTLVFVACAVLIVLIALLREYQVGSAGAIGRGGMARRLDLALAVLTVVAAALTVQRLAVMAL